MSVGESEERTAAKPGAAPAVDAAACAEGAEGAEGAVAAGAAGAEPAPADSEPDSDPDPLQEFDRESERRRLAEHNALARAFDDVRAASRNGELASAQRWASAGIVPDHMDADEFEMFVYSYWEDHHVEGEAAASQASGASASAGASSAMGPAGQSGAGAGRRASAEAGAEAGAGSAASARGRAAVPHALGSATASVGVPAFLRTRQDGGAGASSQAQGSGGEASAAAGDAGAATQSPDARSAADGIPASGTRSAGAASQAVERNSAGDATLIADRRFVSAPPEDAGVRSGSASRGADGAPSASDASEDDPFSGLDLPEGYRLAEVEGEWVLVPDETAEPAELAIDCSDVVALEGRYCSYWYDRRFMTDAFAHWSFLAAENDDVVTFVDCVREESRTYPRPMPVETLQNDPFNFTSERVFDAWRKVQEAGSYPDIHRIAASNGDPYFFSDKYLDSKYAQSLAEWAAVERKQYM